MKKITITVFVFLCVFAIGTALKTNAAEVKGWLWGGTEDSAGDDGNVNNGLSGYESGVGWVSMDRSNCDSNGDGTTDISNYPDCTPGLPVTTSTDYGVDIPDASGVLSKYAWSENVGWISFNAVDLTGCPNGSCQATVDASRNLLGWARIVSIPQAGLNAGGWQGFVSLSSKNCDTNNDTLSEGGNNCPVTGIAMAPYGVHVEDDGTITKGQNTSYGWSDELGWVDFSKAKTGAVTCGVPSYSNYTCTKDMLDCSLVTNCGALQYSSCTAINSCTGNTDSISLPNANCGACTPTVATCPACVGGGGGQWREVAP